MLLGPVALVPTPHNRCCSWCWNQLSKRLCFTVVCRWSSSLKHSIAFWWPTSDQVVAVCWALLRRIWKCLSCIAEIHSAQYTRAPIAAQIFWIFYLCNWWDSVAKRLFTLALTDLNIFCCHKIHVFWYNHWSVLSGALRDRSKWLCWLTSRDNVHGGCTATITISSEDFYGAVFPSCLEQTWIGAKFASSVLIIPQICSPCLVTYFNESNGSGKCWSPGHCGTDANWFSNWFLTCLAFRYVSRQFNGSLIKPTNSWCNSSGCKSWYALQRVYCQKWFQIGWTSSVGRAAILWSSSSSECICWAFELLSGWNVECLIDAPLGISQNGH